MKGETIMKKGDYIRTPRFGVVRINEVFETVQTMEEAGYTETTHYWDDPDYEVFGKNLEEFRMVFAAGKKGSV